mmetsp:Transcript_82440/g.236933  ORF Transcript_82440/g.236933 Transcript_82440/m.236933 type:complete len:228 (-) Transcript_82440:185-868(-)
MGAPEGAGRAASCSGAVRPWPLFPRRVPEVEEGRQTVALPAHAELADLRDPPPQQLPVASHGRWLGGLSLCLVDGLSLGLGSLGQELGLGRLDGAHDRGASSTGAAVHAALRAGGPTGGGGAEADEVGRIGHEVDEECVVLVARDAGARRRFIAGLPRGSELAREGGQFAGVVLQSLHNLEVVFEPLPDHPLELALEMLAHAHPLRVNGDGPIPHAERRKRRGVVVP